MKMSLTLKGIAVILSSFIGASVAYAADVELPGIGVNFSDDNAEISNAVKIFVGMTALSLAPAALVVMTSFIRIIVVLSMLRMALGMQQTPPNTVLISLALFLTLFNMMPTFSSIDENAIQPYIQNEISIQDAVSIGKDKFRGFMLRQTREEDLLLMVDLAKAEVPKVEADVSFIHLVPAFILSELKIAFQIGFIIFLPFLLVDIVVASILMSMGMMMVPPMMISLPIKILMFILIDGWFIVTKSLMESFYT
jgi:flagellar biosynthetic protein FliP